MLYLCEFDALTHTQTHTHVHVSCTCTHTHRHTVKKCGGGADKNSLHGRSILHAGTHTHTHIHTHARSRTHTFHPAPVMLTDYFFSANAVVTMVTIRPHLVLPKEILKRRPCTHTATTPHNNTITHPHNNTTTQ